MISLQNQLSTDDYHKLMVYELEDLANVRWHALEKVRKDKELVLRHYNKKLCQSLFRKENYSRN
mgnify:CR=1 FL=1